MFSSASYKPRLTVLFIPPDPMGAAGPERVVGVVNAMIEARMKAGALLWRDGLSGLFAGAAGVGAGTLGTFTFDPKVVYDHHAGRFVVVTLELNQVAAGSASNASRILIAVSKTSTPATATGADWWYWSINSANGRVVAALVVGFAHAITVVLNDGHIMDTLTVAAVHGAAVPDAHRTRGRVPARGLTSPTAPSRR